MMKRLVFALCGILLVGNVSLADTPPAPAPTPRVSIFSTSTDWQGITGLLLNEYRGVFKPDSKLIGTKGIILYYLDGFPCYGLGEGVRVWFGPRDQRDGNLWLACVYAPTEINFSYRHAGRDADDATNTGMLTCPVTNDGRELNIDMSKCKIGKDWSEYR